MTPPAKKQPDAAPAAGDQSLDETLPVAEDPGAATEQPAAGDPPDPGAAAPADDPVVLDREEWSQDELAVIAEAAVAAAHQRSAGGAVHVAVALAFDGDEALVMVVDNAENLQVGIDRARELVLIAGADVAAAAMLDGKGAARAHVEGVYEGVIHAFDWQTWYAGAPADVSDAE